MPPAVIFDIDGTLIDTNYQHALAWYRAFRQHDLTILIWQIHRAIGIGSDRVVELLAGEDIEREKGDSLRAAEGPLYQEMIDEVQPVKGAHELLADLNEAGHAIILASSAEAKDAERYVELLDARDLIDGYTTSAEVKESKPEPDIVNAAVQKAGGGPAVMIGDSTWDSKAATRAQLPSIGVLTGGFSEQELTDAGARRVFDSVDHLRKHLTSTTIAETVNLAGDRR